MEKRGILIAPISAILRVFLDIVYNGSLLILLLLKFKLKAMWIMAKCCDLKKPQLLLLSTTT